MLGLNLSQNNNITKLHKPTFAAFYTIVKGLFAILPVVERTEMEYKHFYLLKYFGKNKLTFNIETA